MCFSYTLSAARQSFEDRQCRLYEKRFFFLRSAGNLERQKCIFSSSSIDRLSGTRTRMVSTLRTCKKAVAPASLTVVLTGLHIPGKSDQQKPKDNPTPAFNMLALLKPEVKDQMAYSSFACISIKYVHKYPG